MTIYLRRKNPPLTNDKWEKRAMTDNQGDFQALNDDLDHLSVLDIERDQEYIEADERALAEVPAEPEPPKPKKKVSNARQVIFRVGYLLKDFQNVDLVVPDIQGFQLISASRYGKQLSKPKVKKTSPVKKAKSIKSESIFKRYTVNPEILNFNSIQKKYLKKLR